MDINEFNTKLNEFVKEYKERVASRDPDAEVQIMKEPDGFLFSTTGSSGRTEFMHLSYDMQSGEVSFAPVFFK